MLRLLFLLYFLASVFFFLYFIWKRKLLYSLCIVIAFIILFAIGAYFSSTITKNNWCLQPHKAPFTSELPLKLETAEDYFIRGNFAYDQGRCNDAIEDYTKAIELDPTISQIYNNRGYTYMQKRDYEKALNDYEKAIQVRPGYARALLNKGDIYNSYLVDKKKAVETYRQILPLGKYAIRDTMVCGRLLMAEHNWFTPGWFTGFFNLVRTGGQSCY
ncbi:MAG: hypothetical protein A2W22_04760 [Candidatus Levybacteria bacterium RBG_16_35_11]|nr:MAG: hypothetical protein A2W22_04760 [Candidatus Levybacteria bacterium RBG_16_35_11]